MEGREVRIYNAVFGGYDLKGRWRTYEYFVRAQDTDDAAGAFGQDWHHGFGDTAIRSASAPEIRLSRSKTVEFPADHRIVCVSHPDIHVGWSSYVAVPDPFGLGCGIPTKNNRPEVKPTFGRHTADTCWLATDEQTQKIEALDAWSLWAHFGMRRTARMSQHSLKAFGLIAEATGD